MDNSEILREAEKILGKKLKCIVPFEHLWFLPDGNICPCCPALVDNYTLGNIFEQSFDEIWNGERAQEFRQSIIKGDFKFCNLNSCLTMTNLQSNSRYNCSDKTWERATKNIKPKEAYFNIDTACNTLCIMCRDQNITCQIQKYEQITDKVIIPLLKDVKTVYINGSGEVFASKTCMNLIKKITHNCPKIKFYIITNGTLANEKTFNDLGLRNGKVKSIEVSMHAFSKQTYEKIVRNGNFDNLIENLKFISQLKRNKEIKYFWLNFVVSIYNYKEMIDFQKFADSIGAKTKFWEYRKWGNAELDKHYDEVAVFEPTHPEYKEYLKIVENKIFDSLNCDINNKLRPLSTHC